MKKRDLLARYYKEVWEDGDLEKIDNYFNLQCDTQRLLPDRKIEPDEIREWVSIIRSFVTNIKVELVNTIEDGDWISAFLVVRCNRIDTGADVTAHQQIMLRFSGDLKVESYPRFDFLRFFEQIGQLPENTYALLMGGNRLG